MGRLEMQQLLEGHTKMQQTIARMSDNAEQLTVAQAANAGYKRRIAEQDASALRIDAQHKEHVEGMGKSFSSYQDGIQAVVVQMLDNTTQQLLQANDARDTNKRLHQDCVRELTESFDGKLAEQTKASELADVQTRAELTECFNAKLAEQEMHTRTELTQAFDAKLAEQEMQTRTELKQAFDAKLAEQEVQTRAELTECFNVKLAQQANACKLAEQHTRSELHLASQELLGFKQGMCLPAPVPDPVDLWNEPDDAAAYSVESINDFLDGSGVFTRAYEHAAEDEITRVLAAAACGQKRSVDTTADAGLCAFELQAMVYPSAGGSAGAALGTKQAVKSLPGQRVAWSPPPRELCFVAVAL